MGKPTKERHLRAVLAPLTEYIEVQPALHMVRVMKRFFDEVVNCPAFEPFTQALRVGYMEILNEELASYALNLALAIAELEVVSPENADDGGAEERGAVRTRTRS